MPKKQKLELTWIGKEQRPKLEPRILIEDPEKSYHAAERVSENDIFDNMLIHGDNLLALKSLQQEFAGKVKCIYIDPPYNTGQMFENYDDGVEHSIWLGQMRERFELLIKLLSNDGVIFCQLNDEEFAYCKVLMDEVFGRSNFLNQVSVKMKQTSGASGGGEDKKLKKNMEYILIYTKRMAGDGCFDKFNTVYDEEDLFEYIDEMRDSGKSWKYTRVIKSLGEKRYLDTVPDGSGDPIKIYVHDNVILEPISKICKNEGIDERSCYVKYFDKIFRDTNAQSSIRTRVMDRVQGEGDFFSIKYVPRSGKNKGTETELFYKGANCDLFAWLSDISYRRGNGLYRREKAGTYWDGFPLNNLTKEGGVKFPKGKKPEALLQKVLELSTSRGDLVLDSFLGSGTTAAVAHKMGRRWIGIELGEHCETHCLPRLKKVIDGKDTGGITKLVKWQGGGGFRYYELGPSLIEEDKWGNPIISKEFDPPKLTQAMCKLEGFDYAPDPDTYWMQGHSSETDFIYVTSQTMSKAALSKLSDEVGDNRSLLVCCPSFRAKEGDFPNLTLKKIPKAVLKKCEWGRDDYSLQIQELPAALAVDEEAEATAPKKPRRKFGKNNPNQEELF
jgi:adenine-specific DNA-methyltransferase